MAAGHAIVVTGLPGGGKSTVGRVLAARLGLLLLDKDAYLEALFDARGAGDAAWRQRLSRESDALLERDARATERVVLVSHWRPVAAAVSYGTPTDWLAGAFGRLTEVYCRCAPDEAARRFVARERHPGHLDGARRPEEVRAWLRRYGRCLPLGLGRTLTVRADAAPDAVAADIDRVCAAITAGGAAPV